LRSFGEQSPLFSKVFPKKNATLISRTRDTPNLTEKCSSTIPDKFVLQITRDDRRECRVIWRTDDALGVEFINQMTLTNEPTLVRNT
jgi:hypothetical protein